MRKRFDGGFRESSIGKLLPDRRQSGFAYLQAVAVWKNVNDAQAVCFKRRRKHPDAMAVRALDVRMLGKRL